MNKYSYYFQPPTSPSAQSKWTMFIHIERGELSQFVQKFVPFWIFSQSWNQERKALLLLEFRIKIKRKGFPQWVRIMLKPYLPTIMNFLLAPFSVTQQGQNCKICQAVIFLTKQGAHITHFPKLTRRSCKHPSMKGRYFFPRKPNPASDVLLLFSSLFPLASIAQFSQGMNE